MNLKNTKLFSKKLIGFLLIGLIVPSFILAQELDGILLTGLFTDSEDTQEQEILNQGVAETFNVRPVWTYDQTNIITGSLGVLSVVKNIASPTNGLEEPLLSEISGYQKKVIAHSAGVTTVVSLAKQSRLWGDELYIVSQVLISQDDLRQIRDLTSQGKGFNKIVLYTGDDMIPNFKELSINLTDYTLRAKITENWEVSLAKLMYEDRGQAINVLKEVLNRFATRAKEQLGKEPVSVTIYGDIPGNKFEIEWEDGTIESFNLQKDTQTGEDFQDEENITIIPLYEGFPHGREQLEVVEKFSKEYERMPEKEDLELFKQFIKENVSKSESTANIAHDPNEKLVSPQGNVMSGDRLDYAINYENEGEGIAFGVYISDTLEEDLDDSTLIVNAGGTYDSETRTLTWFIGEVGPGEEGSVTFSINVKENVPDNAEVINFATVYFPSVPEATRTNGTVNRIVTFVDDVPPTTTASISPSPNQAGWNNTDVIINLSAIDNEEGLGVKEIHYTLTGVVTGSETILGDSAQIYLTTEGVTNLTYYAIDNADNVETEKSLEIRIDKTLPEAIINIPLEGSEFLLNEPIFANWSVTDGLSGISSATGTSPNGGAINTATVGKQIFSVLAIDNAGNELTQTVIYYVRYSYSDILQPINSDGTSVFKLGRTVPVKFQLEDYSNAPVDTAVARIYLAKISDDVVGEEVEGISTSQATTGNLFRYDSTDNLYIFNLSTNGLTSGTWQVRIDLDDGTSKYVNFGLK